MYTLKLGLLAFVLSFAILVAGASNNDDNNNNKVNGEQVVFQLVKPDSSHTNLEIVPEGIKRLKSISEKVVVISALGAYHSGKSFLLNQMMKEQEGFALGPTIAPETKGIWARIAYTDGKAIVFLDTEGFFGQGASELYDAKIFAVATLLSSKLLFNSVKTIDQASLDYLEYHNIDNTLLARRALMFSLKASVKEDNGGTYLSFPSLTWVVRDFISDIPASYGGGSPSVWLNHLLTLRKRESVSFSNGGDDESFTNQEISKIFSSIDCHPLPFPINTHPEKLRNLEKVPIEELDPKFKEEIVELRRKILSNMEGKKFRNQELNGIGLSELLKTLVELANTGIFPKVPGVWEGFIRVESQTALGDCMESFKRTVHSRVNTTLPSTESALQRFMDEEHDSKLYLWSNLTRNIRAIQVLRAMLLGLESVQVTVSEQLKNELGKLRESFQEENARNIERFCSTAREAKEAELDSRVSRFNYPLSPSALREHMRVIGDEIQQEYMNRVSAYAGSPQCSASANGLMKYLEKVSANVDATNLVALRKSCAEAKSHSTQQFSLLLSSLSLPLSPSLVKAECNRGLETSIREFDEATAAFKGTEALTEIRKELEQVLQLRKENTILANNNAIEEKILSLSEQIVTSKTKKYTDYKLRTADELKNTVDKFKKEAISSFEESATYAHESSSYSAWKLQFTNNLQQAADTMILLNQEQAKSFYSNSTESLLKNFRAKLRGVKAMIPLEDKEIDGQIDSHVSGAREEWRERVGKYADANPSAFSAAKLNFETEMKEAAVTLRRENVNELLRLSRVALERGERRLEVEYNNAWFQSLFKRQVYNILREELGETIKSERLRDEAIQAYIEDHLDKRFPFSTLFSYLQMFGIFVTAVAVVVAVGAFVQNPTATSPPKLHKY